VTDVDLVRLPHEVSGSRVGVRVWGVVEDRLIEVRVEPAESDAGLRVEGIPEDRARTTADRVRAALINSGLVREVPAAVVTLEPNLRAGRTSELDVSIALALLIPSGGWTRISKGSWRRDVSAWTERSRAATSQNRPRS
jgi:hypothetical protein